jgi:hypothetical protein
MSVHEQQRAGQQPRHVHTLRDSTAHVHMANVDVVVHEQLAIIFGISSPSAKVHQTPRMPACPRLALAERMAGMQGHCVRTAAGHRTEAHRWSPQLLHHAQCSMRGGRPGRVPCSDELSHFMK